MCDSIYRESYSYQRDFVGNIHLVNNRDTSYYAVPYEFRFPITRNRTSSIEDKIVSFLKKVFSKK